jgi:hypothetical protein
MVLHQSRRQFIAMNIVVWLAMVVILVVVPDTLEAWLPIQFARVAGWAVACAVWVVAVERHWQARVGPLVRFGAQLVLWVAAAVLAIWISDQFKVRLQ